jgi:hypothetical protein
MRSNNLSPIHICEEISKYSVNPYKVLLLFHEGLFFSQNDEINSKK